MVLGRYLIVGYLDPLGTTTVTSKSWVLPGFVKVR